MEFSFNDVKLVMSLMADEESKAIFWERFKFAVTGEKRFLLDAVSDSYKYNEIFANPSNIALVEILKLLSNTKEKSEIVIFGASDKAMTIVELLYEFSFLEGNI